MENDVMAHLTTAGIAVYALERLKNLPGFSWISADTKKLNTWLNAIIAAVVAIGIDYTYNPTDRVITIHLPTLSAAMLVIYEWAKQYVAQQLIYDGIVQRAGAPK